MISLESIAAGSQSGWVGSLYEFRLGNAEQLLMLYYAMNSGALAYNEATLAYGMGALSRFGSYASVGVEGAADVTNGRYKDDITGDPPAATSLPIISGARSGTGNRRS